MFFHQEDQKIDVYFADHSNCLLKANPLHQPVPALNVQNSPVNGASVPVTPSSPGAVTADTMGANLLEALKGVEYTKKLERKYHAAQQSIQKRDDRIKALNEENKRWVAHRFGRRKN